MLKHGGQLLSAVEKYGIKKSDWLDLSTGINPCGWPVPEIPADIFQQLPEKNDGLESAAAGYYQCESLLPIAGSQAAIQCLPKLRSKSRVLLPETGYREHQDNWRRQGHDIYLYSQADIEKQMPQADVLVVINPNNPAGDFISTDQLLEWHVQLAKKGGWLIVDEAFMDAHSENSIAHFGGRKGLIVLRSVGKFFGLAGIRSGFVLAEDLLLRQIEAQLGPWAVSNVARHISREALLDKHWQARMKKQLESESKKLKACLSSTFKQPLSGCSLFQTLMTDCAEVYYSALAKQGVLVRLLDNRQGLRFGLPQPDQWSKLERVLQSVEKKVKG